MKQVIRTETEDISKENGQLKITNKMWYLTVSLIFLCIRTTSEVPELRIMDLKFLMNPSSPRSS